MCNALLDLFDTKKSLSQDVLDEDKNFYLSDKFEYSHYLFAE